MNFPPFSPSERTLLSVLAGFGLIVPNGVFLYVAATDREALLAAIGNPIAAVFMAEAFFLMALFAWLLSRVGSRRPGAFLFVVLSLVGSMAFSVPLALRWLGAGRDRGNEP